MDGRSFRFHPLNKRHEASLSTEGSGQIRGSEFEPASRFYLKMKKSCEAAKLQQVEMLQKRSRLLKIIVTPASPPGGFVRYC